MGEVKDETNNVELTNTDDNISDQISSETVFLPLHLIILPANGGREGFVFAFWSLILVHLIAEGDKIGDSSS